ncbi:YbaK/EbsC family protein [Acetanaerobacterium elongatum]|uniref:Cys-tRNA(Pro) deacylase, prolyl-tRNA editing enzyme YbaK/EbsC n=1 Tax=Acetanaerobacterium elongatum TaxID=258515 RepID=A0A1G9WM40_9FIRM|nr:YbaK/EbsC family protein [Acetanaerobacterium elongatum]SDM85672.1 Cys-tRNA(Pro) deacylase, prolyl-tRNA editing enzyme YbaK/EbsC [Acetanaerobacterium elongatum]
MSVEKVKKYLAQYGKDSAVTEFSVSSATVALAAEALGVSPSRIAKTISFTNGSGGCTLIVAAGDAKIDNSKYKAHFGIKATMLTPEEALQLTGHAVGGVCPFAIENPDVAVYIDLSLKRFDTVYPAAGSSNSAVELTCEELFTISRSREWVDVCKGWQEG